MIERINNISYLISQDRFQEALERFAELETEFPSTKAISYVRLAFLIEIGYGLKDEKLIRSGLEAGKRLLGERQYEKCRTEIHYNMANGYSLLYNLLEHKRDIRLIPQSENLQNAKKHFRETIRLIKEFDPNLMKQVWTNFGNCLNRLGRGVEAIYAYNRALRIDKSFSMAIGNRAKALRFFADISGEYRDSIYQEVYQDLTSIVDKPDLIQFGGVHARESFREVLLEIETLFRNKEVLLKKPKHLKYCRIKLSSFERFYLEYCIKERLFLNFHVHEDHCKAAIEDPIFIRTITKKDSSVDSFYRFAKYINQIKEDYAVARLLLVQSQFKRKDFSRLSRRTTYVYTLDYSQFNLYVGLLKSAFKEAYNILDKIAVFTNAYCNVGLKGNQVHFYRESLANLVWVNDKKMIRDKIIDSENISLYALYDIFQDAKAGEYNRIREIRRASTHRNLIVFDFGPSDPAQNEDAYSISFTSMLHETTDLLRLVKSAIIYLINFVNIEENRKRKNGRIVPMFVDTSQFI
jgi:hypothetical protein